jgi:tetratricopeptide (TPR) repeat protein
MLRAIVLAVALLPQQPSEVAARFERAVELQRQGALKEAADEYRAVLRLAPDYAEAHANLGAVLARAGRIDEAIASYETALRLDPKLTPVLINLGLAYFHLAQFEKAAEKLERFIALAPASAQARGLLGLALVEMGRDAEAATHLEATLRAVGDDPVVLYALGLTYLRLDRKEFRSMIERLAALSSGKALSLLLEGQSLLSAGDYSRAVEALTEAVGLNAELPRLHYSLGLSYLLLGERRQAIVSFENEISRKPHDFWSLYYLAFLNEAERNLEAALPRLEAALKIEPRSPEANALLGKILVTQNKFAEALIPLETAVSDGKADSETHYMLARVYQKTGRRKDAEREFAEARRLKNQQLEKERTRPPKPG